ncbi:DeoR/GlpR family DNA-binding transcription regulator [Paenibacillus apiarius]|uniref:DeoR/GlpR family DNA-binding transcription regulator n=1 Tax=Paenibacillus apiarius TaxID=46240 RepID=A0ABT4DV31_9BACL|nr:DeoR/GlpR family DNA-binding transcription regulator [Paenibacillus apiarius]MCY9513472.1 DeoR/GlpR family DNA-binding transcription regulator [Paenibacillus apiarius]MCY9521199.1 DeoR/GlpR family DNA-binding transcription regulator [Paenibacillus apiarius]MCY9553388.1 DeoR/GlpR family DNA-binding transcription regulator [Paenibacillus apiarius]MCY9559578.1 DeoR/GlpR family DNA-binding transcription regulator [Paenibacillus apiarius]MCY9685417.1 DeoR/GlpR family DNA-binding transcription re
MMLLPDERRQYILEQLQRYGKIQVASLASALTVTQETIRRDLDELEAKQMLKRVYGGAVAYSHVNQEPRFEKKSGIEHVAKQAIGEAAAALIQDGDTIVIDVGTTAVELARAIRGVVRVTIVTNSIPAAELLNERLEAKWFDGKVIMLGGVTHPEQKSIAGALTCELLARFRFDKAFISCGGITPAGISDYDMEESLCSALMIQQAKQVYVLGDRSKLGGTPFFRICDLDKVTAVICNAPLPGDWARSGVNVGWITT